MIKYNNKLLLKCLHKLKK